MIFRNEIQESLTLKFALSAAERRKKGLPIISLGLGEPEFDTPKEIIESTVKTLREKNSTYSDSMGLFSFREKLAKKLLRDNHIICDANNIIVTAGAKQAYQLIAMALLEPDDEVIVINPSFVSFIPQLLIAEPNCKIIALNVSKEDFSLPIEHIEKSISSKTKLLILNTPNNPAGYIMKSSELKQIYDFALKHKFFVISDEVYEKLIFTNTAHFSIGSLEEKEPTYVITINGFSKSHAMTGWRLGYACFPKILRSKLLKLQQHINTNTCTFIQEAVNAAFDINNQYLVDYNNRLKYRIENIYQQFLHRNKNVSGILPKGGFFAFMNISKLGIDSNTFCGRLIEETGVALTPGVAFGKDWDDYVRISFATDDKNVIDGLHLIEQFINSVK
jgi:aspartate aminotransferase